MDPISRRFGKSSPDSGRPPLLGSHPDPLGGRRPRPGDLAAAHLGPAAGPGHGPAPEFDEAVRRLLASPGVGPDLAPTPSTSTAPMALPPGFAGRFARAAEAYSIALHRYQRRRRAFERLSRRPRGPEGWSVLGRSIGRLDRLYREENDAVRALYAAEDKLAALIRSATAGRPVRFPEWQGVSPDTSEGWATVEWGGAAFGLDAAGTTVLVRPAALAVRLDR